MKELELVIKNYSPAVIDINIEEIDNFMEDAKKKYADIVVTEKYIKEAEKDRATLNKLEKGIADVRKTIDKKAKEQIEPIINRLKEAERETKALSENINNQLKDFLEKQWFEKEEEISEIIDNIFRENPEFKIYLEINNKWKNKTFTLKKIEEEIESQFKELLTRKSFIEVELEKANSEIEFKILFETVAYLMACDYADISSEIEKQKIKIKTTEENLRQMAKEQAEREAEEKIRKEQNEKVQTFEPVWQTNEVIESRVEKKKDTYISIKVSGLSKEATNDLLEVIKKHNIKYVKEMR